MVPFYATPKQITFCGEPVPLHHPDVFERFDREFTIVVYNHAQVYLWLKRKQRHFPAVERQLAAQGLPDDLKYVAVAESDLMVSACSPAGAVGPWQFIPSTGRNYGLSQTNDLDERRDFEMSSQSAFRYLKDLHAEFRNWPLAVAGYNCGEGRVRDEIRKQRVYDYYMLKLPAETERYVLRIIAIKAVLSEPEKYGYHLPPEAAYPEPNVDRVNVSLNGPVLVQSAAEAVGISYREFKTLNPAYVSDTLPAGSHRLLVPKGKGKDLEVRLAGIRPVASAPQEEPTRSSKPAAPRVPSKAVYHKVKKGDTLSSVARRYDVDVDDLKRWNKIKGSNVKVGEVLKILR
jgi:LysM repeat protein